MHWWESNGSLIERERRLFEAAGLAFTLDEAALERGAVVFQGELRYRTQRCPARVLYPAAFAAGQQPAVTAPTLPIDRHKSRDGTLCLDHAAHGEPAPMSGAEAVQRAEELWRLTEDDPSALLEQEARTPDPRVDYYDYTPGSGVIFADVDVTNYESGFLRLGLTHSQPLRGALSALGAGANMEISLPISTANAELAGPLSLPGLWQRVGQRPPGPEPERLGAWIREQHAGILARAQALARTESALRRQALPALIAFVFPDELAHREWGDTWMIYTLGQDGTHQLTRVYSISRDERWVRQPQLAPLGERGVVLLGTGALGSPLGAHLARAGVGAFFLVDPDIITPGNRVRHESDLADVGWPKVVALGSRIVRINPYAQVTRLPVRYGAAVAGGWAEEQLHDQVTQALRTQDLIINATAHISTGYHVSAIADAARRPALHVMVSSGAWSGRILLQRHDHSGCLECLAWHQHHPIDESPDDLGWNEDPALPLVADAGCSQATFVGPGFDIAATAAAAARLAVQTLLGADGYPAAGHDMVTLRFRDADAGEPQASYSRLPRHPQCGSCTGG